MEDSSRQFSSRRRTLRRGHVEISGDRMEIWRSRNVCLRVKDMFWTRGTFPMQKLQGKFTGPYLQESPRMAIYRNLYRSTLLQGSYIEQPRKSGWNSCSGNVATESREAGPWMRLRRMKTVVPGSGSGWSLWFAALTPPKGHFGSCCGTGPAGPDFSGIPVRLGIQISGSQTSRACAEP